MPIDEAVPADKEDTNWNAAPGHFEERDGKRFYIVTVESYGGEQEWVVCPECDAPQPGTPCHLCNTMHHDVCMERLDISKIEDPLGEKLTSKIDMQHVCSSCKEDLEE